MSDSGDRSRKPKALGAEGFRTALCRMDGKVLGRNHLLAKILPRSEQGHKCPSLEIYIEIYIYKCSSEVCREMNFQARSQLILR